MEGPQGISDIGKDDCIILNKCIYGLFQSLRKYSEKAVKILKKLRFAGGNVDPYLYVEKSEKGIVSVALHIDDNLMVGDIEVIDNVIATLNKNGLILNVMEGLQN